MHRTPGVRARNHRGTRVGPGPLDGGDLAVSDPTRQLGLQRRVGATGATAQPVVVEFHHVGDVGRTACEPSRGSAARAGGDTGSWTITARSGSRRSGQPVEAGGQPLVDVQHPVAEPCRGRGPEQVRRSPSSRRRIRPSRRESVRRRASSRSPVGPAQPRRRAGRRGRGARRSRRRVEPGTANVAPVSVIECRGAAMGLALPRVHHAAGEEPHVGLGCRRRRGDCRRPAERQRRDTRADAEPSGGVGQRRVRTNPPAACDGARAPGNRLAATTA